VYICYASEFWGFSFVNRLCPRICDSVIYFIHQMAIHNATKLLPLTNHTKLTLTITLTLTDTVTIIFCMCISLTPIKGCTSLIKGIFRGGVQQSLWVGQLFALPINCTTRLLMLRQEVDSSYFIIRRGFLLWGIYKKKGLSIPILHLSAQNSKQMDIACQ